MIPSKLRSVVKTSVSAMALGGIFLFGPLLPQQAKAYQAAYTTTNATPGGYTAGGLTSSFGFFFELLGDHKIDGLGFAAQSGWGSGQSYTVTLWKYDLSASPSSVFTPITSVVFDPSNAYTLQDKYYWQPLSGGPIDLADSFIVDNSPLGADVLGYVISTIGDFSGAPGGVVPEIVESGIGTVAFDPRIIFGSDGYNDDTDSEFPIPYAQLTNNGYFNPNISFAEAPPVPAVPGPLPVIGAAAGFAWTRRLRKRIRNSN
jgi:hypothetical protein